MAKTVGLTKLHTDTARPSDQSIMDVLAPYGAEIRAISTYTAPSGFSVNFVVTIIEFVVEGDQLYNCYKALGELEQRAVKAHKVLDGLV